MPRLFWVRVARKENIKKFFRLKSLFRIVFSINTTTIVQTVKNHCFSVCLGTLDPLMNFLTSQAKRSSPRIDSPPAYLEWSTPTFSKIRYRSRKSLLGPCQSVILCQGKRSDEEKNKLGGKKRGKNFVSLFIAGGDTRHVLRFKNRHIPPLWASKVEIEVPPPM